MRKSGRHWGQAYLEADGGAWTEVRAPQTDKPAALDGLDVDLDLETYSA